MHITDTGAQITVFPGNLYKHKQGAPLKAQGTLGRGVKGVQLLLDEPTGPICMKHLLVLVVPVVPPFPVIGTDALTCHQASWKKPKLLSFLVGGANWESVRPPFLVNTANMSLYHLFTTKDCGLAAHNSK